MGYRNLGIRAGVLIGAAGLALLAGTGVARADHEFDWIDFDTDGQTIGAVSGEVRVGYNNPAPITVFADGATEVDGFVYLFNNATLDVRGGSIGFEVDAMDRSTVSISGGYIENSVIARDGATAIVSGGDIGDLTAIDRGFTAVLGGWVREIDVFDKGRGYVAGGEVGEDASAYFGSVLVIAGGSIGGNVIARQDATVHLLGGTVGGDIISFGNGVVNVYGEDLSLSNPQPVIGGGFVYDLTGVLADGTPIDNSAYILETGAINLVDVNEKMIPPLPALLGGQAVASLEGGN